MYYTYLWLRHNGTPYYVGKGSGNRGFTSHDHRLGCPEDRTRIITQEFLSETDAFAAEIFLIAYYGRLDIGSGCLRNLTEGGENPPPRRIKSHCIRGHKREPGRPCKACVKILNALNRHKYKESKNQKRRKFGVMGSEELRVRTVQRAKEQWLDPEYRGNNPTNRKAGGHKTIRPGLIKPFCSRGHARTPDNVYGSGGCKVCVKQRGIERRLEKH